MEIRRAPIPLSKVDLHFPEYWGVFQVLRSGKLAQGDRVLKLEQLFSLSHNSKPCVAVNSGTSGLHIALLALGIEPGDEVIVPSFSFAATANAVRLVGATPVFCDVDLDTYCIDPEMAKSLINKKTKGIVPVHIFGLSVDLEEIYSLARKHDLKVIEDAAQAHGAEYKGKRIGYKADAVVYSFYPTKNVTSGEGGIIVFASEESANLARLLRNQGMKQRYVHEVVGMNLRMSEIHAAIGVAQSMRIESIALSRAKNAEFYRDHLNKSFIPQMVPQGVRHVYHQFVVRVDKRDEVRLMMEKHGVETAVYYPTPIHKQKPFNTGLSLPHTDYLCSRVLAIPVRETLTSRQRNFIVRIMNGIARDLGF
jgi:dTDP-4-amino-4,6-dideoxygalactose transaminase